MYLYFISTATLLLIILLNRMANILFFKYSLIEYSNDFNHLNSSRCSLFYLFDDFINTKEFSLLIHHDISVDSPLELEIIANHLAEVVLNFINNFDGKLKSGEFLLLEEQVSIIENQYSSYKSKSISLESIYFRYINRFDYKLLSRYIPTLVLSKPFFINERKEEMV